MPEIMPTDYVCLFNQNETKPTISRSNAKPSVIGEKHLLFLTKQPNEEIWDCTFDAYGIDTYNGKEAGSWLRDDMDRESSDHILFQNYREPAAGMIDAYWRLFCCW